LGPSSSSANTSNTTSTSGSCSKPTVNVFHSLTTRSNYYCNLPHPQSHAVYVADPVTEMCNQAERAVVHDLEAAVGHARSLGCPVPLDTVTGFETGCHLSGESNVVLLIGWKTVHPIALPSVDEMFNWAEVLERALIDSNYHVTLCRVGSASDNTSASSCVLGAAGGGCGGISGSGGVGSVSTSSSTTSGIIPTSNVVVSGSGVTSVSSSSSSSRLQLGLQASLHVQQWRLCLIGEPSAGCQFIAQWRLDALDAAYTMESGSNSGTFSAFGGSTYDPVGGQPFLGFTPPGAQGVFPTFSTSYQNDDRFFLEANRAAGKGLAGNYVFQVDGRRLGQLARAIDELMLRRFPALTAPPGTRVLPSTNTDDESLHLRKSAAIDIRSSCGASKPLFGASSSSLSPPTGVGGGGGGATGGGGGAVFGSASPHGSSGSFAPSSLPTRGGGASTVPASAAVVEEVSMVPQHSSSSTSSSRSKKSGHRQFFGGAQTLGRSDAIKIPTRRFTTALSKMTGDGGFSSRGRSSSKTGSGEGSAEGSSSDASSTKPQPPLYFPSVMVGAGIITSLVPAPPPPSQSARYEVFGTSAAPPVTAASSLRPKQKSELPPPPPLAAPPPPPPHPLSHCTPPSSPFSLACERCQRRRQRDHQKTPSADPASISSEDGGGGVGGGGNGGGIFAADEDVEQPMPLAVVECRRSPPTHRAFYNLYKQVYHAVEPFHTNCRLPRSGSFDVCTARKRKLARERVFEALGGGEGSPLDCLLHKLSPPLDNAASCVFLLAFSPPLKPLSKEEMEYRWYLVHRPGSCCSRCCLWNAPIFLAELNLQDVVAHQMHILSLKKDMITSEPLRSIPCGAIPCLSTSRLFVWQFSGGSLYGEMSQCSSHVKSTPLRPWSVLYLGPDSEIDDGTLPVSPSVLSVSSPYCCCYCGSPLSQPQCRSRIQQQHQQSQYNQPPQLNYHAYANLIRNIGSSTLPSVSRRSHHHQTAPVVFPEKPSASRDIPVDQNRRGVFSTSSTSCSTSQASSPSSPQGHVSYYNLTSNVGIACLPPNPLKYSFHEERSSGAYANLQHLYAPLNPQQARLRMPCSVRTSASTAVTDQIPDEIREPKRNYALVDLRPSPASSVIAPGDTITLVSTSEDAVLTTPDGGVGGGVGGCGSGSRTDSSASTLHTNTSTSSSAATFVPGNGGNRPRTASQHRRTSSHSLIAVLPVPTLNYVHIMTKRDAEAAAAGAAGCESPASSSTATSSTASSSEKEQRAPTAVPLNLTTTAALAPHAEQIPYAQIDFERTRALNAVNGAGEVNHLHGHHFHHSHHHKAATNAFTTPLGGGKTSLVSGCGGLRGLSARKKSDGW
uniref:Protein kinase domain-containing protein n=1 Tax=Hydatigena taeniaeformis TaxID=6205 RepID=A0A0R3X073_HYDTA